MAVGQPSEDTIFEAALEIQDAAERKAFLTCACGDNLPLRMKIEKLLGAYRKAEQFFADCQPALMIRPEQEPVNPPPSTEAEPGGDEEIGSRVGPYKLLQKIGEGGCGAVYMAEQQKPMRRRVAVKIVKLGMDTKAVIARFEAERQALALMDHPNIARVLDAGTTETGRPYFVMELVHGIRITDYCDQRQLDTRERLELFIQVCHAIQHAHQKGIIHRDIKPSNILITLHDDVPVPKVIDFGIAKATGEERLTDKTLFTVYGHFVGTPAYMSPEQADISGLDIDTRSDIYSLGVLLYELLTGKTPFAQDELLESGFDEMRRTLREREPHRPSTKLDILPADELTITATRRHIEPPQLRLLLKGDLDWIVMKCLEKDRKRRYETANGIAMDVQRFLNHEPVVARPPSRGYRFQKLVRRNRVLFAASGMVALALVLGLGASTAMFLEERLMRHRAVVAEQRAEQARAKEAALRQQAETREMITRTALLVNEGKLDAADRLARKINFQQPTLEGAAALRALGQWHVLNGQWDLAGARFLQTLQVDQLDSDQTVSLDFLRAGAALAMAGDTNRFDRVRRRLAIRFANETSPLVIERLLEAALMLPGDVHTETLQSLAEAILPAKPMSIGDPSAASAQASGGSHGFLRRFKLQDVGTTQPDSMSVANGLITIVAGGADIWENKDEFVYICKPIAGDFDFRMRVRSIAPELNTFTRVGLMARESSDQPGSRHVMVAVNAGDTFQVVMRPEAGAPAMSVPQNPLPAAYGSNSWVRLQRVGAIFHAYASSNGVDWTQLYQTTGGNKPFDDPIYFGIAASSHDPNAVATNVVSNFGPTPVISAGRALSLALLEYRQGKFAEAAKWCRRLIAYPECTLVQTSTARVILALASDHLKQRTAARWQLVQAHHAVESNFSGGLATGGQIDGPWYNWAVARVLVQQAEALIH